MPFRGRDLIIAIARDLGLGPGTSVKEMLPPVARLTGISVRSLESCWKRQYESKTTISKLQQAANNADNLASKYEALAVAIEKAGGLRTEVDEVRRVARRFGRVDRRTRALDNGEV